MLEELVAVMNKKKPLNNLVTQLPSHALVKGRWHINCELLVMDTMSTKRRWSVSNTGRSREG